MEREREEEVGGRERGEREEGVSKRKERVVYSNINRQVRHGIIKVYMKKN